MTGSDRASCSTVTPPAARDQLSGTGELGDLADDLDEVADLERGGAGVGAEHEDRVGRAGGGVGGAAGALGLDVDAVVATGRVRRGHDAVRVVAVSPRTGRGRAPVPWISSIVYSPSGRRLVLARSAADGRGLGAGGEVRSVVVAVGGLVGAPGGGGRSMERRSGAVSKVLVPPKPTRSITFALLRIEPVGRVWLVVPLASHDRPPRRGHVDAADQQVVGRRAAATVGGRPRCWSGSGSAHPPGTVPDRRATPLGRRCHAEERYWSDLPFSEIGDAEMFLISTKSALRLAPELPPPPYTSVMIRPVLAAWAGAAISARGAASRPSTLAATSPRRREEVANTVEMPFGRVERGR